MNDKHYIWRNGYQFLVKVNPGGRNYCEYPKKAVMPRKFRGMGIVYFQYSKSCQRITYDKSLWLTEVIMNDPIEEEIIKIINEWPNWYAIDVYPKEEN